MTLGRGELNSYVTLEGFSPRPSSTRLASFGTNTLTARAHPQTQAASRRMNLGLMKSAPLLGWTVPRSGITGSSQAEQTRPRWTLGLSQRTAGVRTQARLSRCLLGALRPLQPEGHSGDHGLTLGECRLPGGAETRRHRWEAEALVALSVSQGLCSSLSERRAAHV